MNIRHLADSKEQSLPPHLSYPQSNLKILSFLMLVHISLTQLDYAGQNELKNITHMELKCPKSGVKCNYVVETHCEEIV